MWTAIRFTILIFLIGAILYPLTITALGQAFFPEQANGSLVQVNNHVIGSSLIAQPFSRPAYFHPRPSAADYNAMASGGSNYGPTYNKMIERTVKDAHAYQQKNLAVTGVPIDAITTSGSGLDPHITLANALAQVPRVAKTRQMEPESVKQLIMDNVERPLFAQAPYVNVLKLNLVLEKVMSLKVSE